VTIKRNLLLYVFIHFAGEPCSVKLIKLLVSCIAEKCNIWNLYGPAETIVCTYHYIDPIADTKTISIGLPMPSYQCVILDEFSQNAIIDQEGELLMGGVGVFAGYLGRDDLTAKVLTEINGELFYRTGDLVRMDNNGLLHYLGRKDHQIK
jgi:non-ribosomal peptide synthetase component F